MVFRERRGDLRVAFLQGRALAPELLAAQGAVLVEIDEVPAPVVDIENHPKGAKLHYRYTYHGRDYIVDR